MISRPLSWLIIWVTALLIFRHGQLAIRVREQETLVRVGAMAAVLAHEVRNPMTGLRHGLEILASRMPVDSGDREAVRAMQARIDVLNELMRDVLRFAHEQPIRTATVPVASLLAALAASLRAEFPAIDLAVELDEAFVNLPGDSEQLQVALSNVLRNAAQAMDGNGRVRLTTQAHGRLCTVQVHDDGPGLPLEMRGHLFEPFVTTKSRGTGLGLAITRRIIEAHQGRITLTCPPAGGTLVTVTLPTGARGTFLQRKADSV
jgi:two-component system sensor histidine kinase HydH